MWSKSWYKISTMHVLVGKGKEWDPLRKVTLVNAYCVGKLAYAVPFLTIIAAKVNKIVAEYWNTIWLCKAFRLKQEDAAAEREEEGMGGLQIRLWLQSHLAVWVP